MAINYEEKWGSPKIEKALQSTDKRLAETKAISEDLDNLAKGTGRKKLVSIRYDEEVLDFFMATGKGWQTLMNEVLLEHVRTKT